MKVVKGRARRQWVGCEALEGRSLAAADLAIASKPMRTIASQSGTPALPGEVTIYRGSAGAGEAARRAGFPVAVSIDRKGRPTEVLSAPFAYLDGDGLLHIAGTRGDDNVRLRAVPGGRVRIDTIAGFDRIDESELGQWGNLPVPYRMSYLYTFELNASDFQAVKFEGGAGDDAVHMKGLAVNAAIDGVEQVDLVPLTAPAGQTPSDTTSVGPNGKRGGWISRVRQERAAADASRAKTAFFGDSHAKLFQEVGHAAWQTYFPRALTLGMGGDTTRQLLARIKGGLFDKFKPDALILSVGANNLNNPSVGGNDSQVAAGIVAVVDALRQRLPQARIVLIGLLPRSGAGMNARVRTIDAMVSAAAPRHRFTFLNVYDRFAADSGRLLTGSSHLTAKGYSALGSMLTAALRSA